MKPLGNAKVVSIPSRTTTDTNEEGLFFFEIPVRDRRLIISKGGYNSDTLNVIFFKNNSTFFLKEIVIENPIDQINQYISFVVSRRDNNIFHYPIENFHLSGFGNLESILSSNNLVTLKTGLDGQKNIAYRESTDSEMDILYDGIKLDGVKNSLSNLSLLPSLATSDIVITKGGHYKLTASKGVINFIPSISYNNKFSLNIEQSSNNSNAALNGYSSLGYRNGVINGSLDEKDFAVGYSDTSIAEVFTSVDRNSFNIAFTNRKNFDIRLMSFDNMKNYSNQRTKSSVSDTLKNRIIKLSQWSPLTGLITLYGLSQVNNDFSYLINDIITKDYEAWCAGMSLEKDFENSIYTFSTMTNIANAKYFFNVDSLFLERQNSTFSGSAKYFFPSNKRNFNFKSFSIVYTKERTTDIPKTKSSLNMLPNYWDNNSIQLRSSAKIKNYPKLLLFYINMGKVLKSPSIDEILGNRVRSNNYKKGLLPEEKIMFEFGFTFSDNEKSKPQKLKTDFSFFNHNYINKIQRIMISGTASDYLANFGNVNIYGFTNKITYFPKRDWSHSEITISAYSSSDLSFFHSHPALMLSHNTTVSTKYFSMILKMRSEGKKYIHKNSVHGRIETLAIKKANYLDVIIYKNLNYKIFNVSVSLLAENLFFKKIVIDNLNLFDNRYSANIHLTVM